MALRQATAERDGSRGATAGAGWAVCGPTVEGPRSFLSTLKAGFFDAGACAAAARVRRPPWNCYSVPRGSASGLMPARRPRVVTP